MLNKVQLIHKYNTGKKLIDAYNSLIDGVDLSKKSSQILREMTEEQVFVFMAARTYNFGRSWADSINNAYCHLEDGVESIIKIVCYPDKEKLYGVI